MLKVFLLMNEDDANSSHKDSLSRGRKSFAGKGKMFCPEHGNVLDFWMSSCMVS